MAQKVLRFTHDETAARAEVAHWGGRIVHQFSPNAFVAELPDSIDPHALTASTAKPTQPLDEVTKLAVTAWTAGQAAKLAQATAAPLPTEGLSWDTPGFKPPRGFRTLSAVADSAQIAVKSTGTPTSLYMIGSVAVGIILVSRNTGTEAFTDAERIKIVQEVQESLDWLSGLEPRAKVSFVYDIRPITVSSAPGPYTGETDPYERFERDWRDAALAAMGYAPGRTGYQRYVNDLRTNRRTDWAYVAFFTKYPLNYFAYAVDEKVVMNYANGDWGPDNINRVFAHETCHIFGAADEYGACTCGTPSGYLAVPNNNCVNCFPPGSQVPCVMNANTLAMCDFSRRQIGWDERLFPTAPPPPQPPPPWVDPGVRQLIDEWLRQQDRCVKLIYPKCYIDRWGRLCGDTGSTVLKCGLDPDHPANWDNYRYLWSHNWCPMYYPYRVRDYIGRRQRGQSYNALAKCKKKNEPCS